eukprot:TRINITY_DN3566_c0_g1_i1.p1 TRINITY_DN3566_c0_g1~~TRINITY_DN3566_c0_g1_i1.p1  ORF type:complete len:683 (+),score=176.17 TRINITY_DN3566_c0_g1_i1:51-2099(+)
MKFGRYLDSNKVYGWEEHYIDYGGLKQMLKVMKVGSTGDQSVDLVSLTSSFKDTKSELNEVDFSHRIDKEVAKINQFTMAKSQEIRELVARLVQSSQSDDHSEQDIAAFEQQVTACEEDLINLEKFVNLNMTGFVKILKKHDKHSPTKFMQIYMVRLWKEPFLTDKLDRVLVSLSRLHTKLRREPISPEIERSAAPESFVRRTRKFWVRLEDVTPLKVMILKSLPILHGDDPNSDLEMVSSVYFDNAAMELYSSRLGRQDGSNIIRARWYGLGEPSKVFVEKKTLKMPITGSYNEKKRFSIDESKLVSFLCGTLSLNDEAPKLRQAGMPEAEIVEMLKLSHEIQRTVEMKQLVPTLRTVFTRTAFQHQHSPELRITLDVGIFCMLERARIGEWKRDTTSTPIPENQVSHFPFAVLEIKTQYELGQAAPAWVQDLMANAVLIPADHFSKYLFGCATLLPNQITTQPGWMAKLESHLPKPTHAQDANPSHPEQHSEHLQHRASNQREGRSMEVAGRQAAMRSSRKDKSDTDSDHEPSRSPPRSRSPTRTEMYFETQYEPRCCPSFGPKKRAVKYPMRVEPKTYFANERTYLAWVKMSLTLCIFAMGFIGLTNKRGVVVGSCILLAAGVLFSVYAYYTFFRRAVQMRAREHGPYDDKFGPGMLVFVLNVAMILSALSAVLIKDDA